MSDLFLSITGMDCASCSLRVEQCFASTKGIHNYNVSLFSNNARLQYNPDIVQAEEIVQQVRQLGFGCEQLASNINASLQVELIPVYAVDDVVQYLRSLQGIRKITYEIKYNWLKQPQHCYLDITYDPSIIGARRILSEKINISSLSSTISTSTSLFSRIFSPSSSPNEHIPLLPSSSSPSSSIPSVSIHNPNRATYAVLSLRQELPDNDSILVQIMWQRLYLGGICTLSATVLAYILTPEYVADSTNTALRKLNDELFPLFSVRTLIQFILSTIALLYLGTPLIIQAYKAARYSYMMTMDTLVSASSLAAYFYSIGMIIAAVCGVSRKEISLPIFETTTILLTLVALGRTIEHSAKKQTVKILKQLASSSNTVADVVVVPLDDTNSKKNIPVSSSCGSSNSNSSNASCSFSLSVETLSTYTIETVSSKLLHLNDIIRVSPGSVVPADSIIIGGQTSIDESTLTGESIPVMKRTNDTIIGGSTNIEGVIYARVLALPGSGALSHIVQLVEEAQSIRPPLQLIADKVASIFTPLIFIISILSFAIWYGLAVSNKINTNGIPPGTFALLFSLALLVVSCPCAISLAVPTATMVATLMGTKFGVLIKNGATLETINKIQHIVFDKTGTLTEGKPVIDTIQVLVPDRMLIAAAKHAGFTVDIVNSSSPTNSNKSISSSLVTTMNAAQAAALILAAEAEEGATHPLAYAVSCAAKVDKIRCKRKGDTMKSKITKPVSSCGSNGDDSGAPSRVSIPGCGVIAEGNEFTIHVGKLSWLLETEPKGVGIDTDIDDTELQNITKDMNSKGLTILGVAIDGKLVALLGAKDNLRPEAKAVVSWLNMKNIAVWIASGDNEGSVGSIAKELNIPNYRTHATLTPEGKANLIDRIQHGSINDDHDNLSSLDASQSNTVGLSTTTSSKRKTSMLLPPRALVMMIGDGVNDAVALCTADVGVAMNNNVQSSSSINKDNATSTNVITAAAVTTSIIAQDAAHIIFQTSNLDILPTLLRLAKVTHLRIQYNFMWAFLYNVLAMPLAGGVLYPFNVDITIPPSLAGISELFSSVPVILGSLLIYTFNSSSAIWKAELEPRKKVGILDKLFSKSVNKNESGKKNSNVTYSEL